MRLIDADKLLEDLKQKRYSKQSLELIQSQPEVNAIPVKWIIKNYLGELRRAGCCPRDMIAEEMIDEWTIENNEEHN